MSYLSSLVTTIAVSDIDVAINGLKDLTDPRGVYYPHILLHKAKAAVGGEEGPDPLKWAHYVCTYSRYVYLNVFKYRPSAKRVRNEVIPILENAKAAIGDLLQRCDLGKEDESDLTHYIENISIRIENLKTYT